jgi:lipopolysaccharide/colanic/teichoic acid biosynthesis glycosyltransferase
MPDTPASYRRRTSLPVVADSTSRRIADVIVAVFGLLAAAPLLLVLGVTIRLTSPGPATFRQARIGRDGRAFDIWKLRTMNQPCPGATTLVSGVHDPRITRIGGWLRRTRLDELPQLINLLKGDLTLIGPRPEVSRFVRHYTAEERMLLQVRPGIIGPGAVLFACEQAAQLDVVDEPEAFYIAHHLHPRLTLDLDYVAHRTLRRDLALVARALMICVRHG